MATATTVYDREYMHRVVDSLNADELSVLRGFILKLTAAQSYDLEDTITDEEYADCLVGIEEIRRGEYATLGDMV